MEGPQRLRSDTVIGQCSIELIVDVVVRGSPRGVIDVKNWPKCMSSPCQRNRPREWTKMTDNRRAIFYTEEVYLVNRCYSIDGIFFKKL